MVQLSNLNHLSDARVSMRWVLLMLPATLYDFGCPTANYGQDIHVSVLIDA
ncbi:MAG: hypothetical protein Cpurp_12950 [Chlorogloea purpurea SAG 13.99]|nr:hypothetical protein [Chlorogloea purpurea SAG 13.99]